MVLLAVSGRLQYKVIWTLEIALILDIPGIQAKEHSTDEELRSLALEALSVAYPSATWARVYTDGSAEEAAPPPPPPLPKKKKAEVEFLFSSPTPDP